MATVNSLLFLLTTLAPNVERPENSSVAFQPPSQWNRTEVFWNDPSGSPSQCPENEEYFDCRSTCTKNCENYNIDEPCSLDCVSGCFCKDPMIRGPNGNCIYEDECPNVVQLKEHASWFPEKECPQHEVYTCGAHCQRRCEKSWWPCPGWCVPGCECIWPRVRGPKGDCIFRDQCPNALTVTDPTTESVAECNADEEVSCYSHCQKNCTNYYQDSKCPIYCVSGCVCKEPKIRGPDGSCILPEECPSSQRWTPKIPIPRICGADERLSPCQGHCQKNCSNFDKKISCPTICLPGCICREPMIRGPNGACILPEQCPASSPDLCLDSEGCVIDNNDLEITSSPAPPESQEDCDENEFYHLCGSTCEADCNNPGMMYQPCPDKRCVAGCFCRLGYVRGLNGRCVHLMDCVIRQLAQNADSYATSSPIGATDNVKTGARELVTPIAFSSSRTCPNDEDYNECGASCPKTCFNYNEVMPCTEQCVPGCVCKAPLVRGPDGNCVHKAECFDVISKGLRQNISDVCPIKYMDFRYDCGLIEEFSCVSKSAKFRMCFAGCLCIRPRVRYNGRCILPEDCPDFTTASRAMELPDFSKLPDLPRLKCKENQEFSFCASVCPDNCTNYDQTDRLCKRICVPGCRCKEGYVIGDDGVCIKKEDCKERKHDECDEFEYYDECGSYCEADCNNYDSTKDCENKGCKKGCFCKPEFVRSADKKCVRPSECPHPTDS